MRKIYYCTRYSYLSFSDCIIGIQTMNKTLSKSRSLKVQTLNGFFNMSREILSTSERNDTTLNIHYR